MGSIAKGLTGGSAKSSSSTSVKVPKWLDAQNQSLVKRAADLSNQAYNPYTGQRVADFTADQNQAFDLTRGNVGKYDNLLNQASTSAMDYAARANGPSSADISQLSNPFIQNVLDTSRRKISEQSGQQQNDLNRKAALNGAFGGSRNAIAQSQLQKNNAELLNDTEYQGLFDAYNAAMSQYNTNTNNIGNAAQLANQTAAGNQAVDNTTITSLLGSGALQQDNNQQQLDTNYGDYQTEQAYPYNQLSFLSSIINPQTANYAGSTTTGSQGSASGSPIGNALGAAASVASIASMFSDERVKENKEVVGQLDNGLDVYKYNYVGDPKTMIGVMAQEVEKDNPDAVTEMNGVKMVDYDKAAGGKETDKTNMFADGGRITNGTNSFWDMVMQPSQVTSAGRNTPSLQFAQQDSKSGGAGGLGDLSSLAGAGKGIMDFFKNGSWGFGDTQVNPVSGAGAGGFQFSGGYFADGGRVDAPNLDWLNALAGPRFNNFNPQTDTKAGQVGRLANEVVNPINLTENVVSGARGAIEAIPDIGIVKDYFSTPAAQVDARNAAELAAKTDKRAAARAEVANNIKPTQVIDPASGQVMANIDDPVDPVLMAQPAQAGMALPEATGANMYNDLPADLQSQVAQGDAAMPPAQDQGPVITVDRGQVNQSSPVVNQSDATMAQPVGDDDVMNILKGLVTNGAGQPAERKELGWGEILGSLGAGMLDTGPNGADFFQQLGKGMKEVQATKVGVNKQNMDLRDSQAQALSDFLAKKAYIKQVEQQGIINPYQAKQLEQDMFKAILGAKTDMYRADHQKSPADSAAEYQAMINFYKSQGQ